MTPRRSPHVALSLALAAVVLAPACSSDDDVDAATSEAASRGDGDVIQVVTTVAPVITKVMVVLSRVDNCH